MSGLWGIRAKILATVVGGLLFVSIVSVVATNTITRSWLELRSVEHVQTQMDHAVEYLLDPLLAGDRLAVEEIVQRTVRGRWGTRYFYVLSQTGEVLGSSFADGVPVDILKANLLPPGVDRAVRVLRTEEGVVLDVGRGILGGRAGQIHLGIDDGVIHKLADTTSGMLALALGGSLVLAVLAAFVLADIIVRPINRLLEATRRVAGGDLTGRVRARSGDEIGELGRGFNLMLDGLRLSRDGLREMAAQAQGIVSSFPSALFVIEPNGRIRSANPAALTLTGLSQSDLAGKDLSSLFVVGPTKEPATNLDCSLKEDTVTLSYDMAIRRPGGAVSPIAFNAAPFRDAFGGFRGYVVEVRDLRQVHIAIEALKRQRSLLEENQVGLFDAALLAGPRDDEVATHLVRSDRLVSLGQLAASVAHEINNPVFAIATSARVLERDIQDAPAGEPDRERLLRVVRRILTEAGRCSKILGEFLSYARFGPAAKDDVHLHAILEDVDALLAGTADAQGVTRVRDLQGTDVVKGAPDQLSQVFLNIQMNALQAMPEGGTLEVVARADEGKGTVRVTLKDTGPGIPPEVIPKVFDPFFTTKGKGQGTGLGLAVVRTLVTRHGGTVEVQSEPGHGTEVVVTLPLLPRGGEA